MMRGAEGLFQLRSDIQANSSADGTPFQIWNCNGTGAQVFQFQADPSSATTGCVGTTYASWVDMTNNPYACDDKAGAACGWSSTNNGEGYTCGRRHPDWASPWTREKYYEKRAAFP